MFKYFFSLDYDKFQQSMWLYVSEVVGPVLDKLMEERYPQLVDAAPELSWTLDWRSNTFDNYSTTSSRGQSHIALYGNVVIAIGIKLDYHQYDSDMQPLDFIWCPYRHQLFPDRTAFFKDYYRAKIDLQDEVKFVSPAAFLQMVEDELQNIAGASNR